MKSLHHLSFEMPTLGDVLSDDMDTFSAFEMQKGVKSSISQVYEFFKGLSP